MYKIIASSSIQKALTPKEKQTLYSNRPITVDRVKAMLSADCNLSTVLDEFATHFDLNWPKMKAYNPAYTPLKTAIDSLSRAIVSTSEISPEKFLKFSDILLRHSFLAVLQKNYDTLIDQALNYRRGDYRQEVGDIKNLKAMLTNPTYWKLPGDLVFFDTKIEGVLGKHTPTESQIKQIESVIGHPVVLVNHFFSEPIQKDGTQNVKQALPWHIDSFLNNPQVFGRERTHYTLPYFESRGGGTEYIRLPYWDGPLPEDKTLALHVNLIIGELMRLILNNAENQSWLTPHMHETVSGVLGKNLPISVFHRGQPLNGYRVNYVFTENPTVSSTPLQSPPEEAANLSQMLHVRDSLDTRVSA